jgi:hypothetical protein
MDTQGFASRLENFWVSLRVEKTKTAPNTSSFKKDMAMRLKCGTATTPWRDAVAK